MPEAMRNLFQSTIDHIKKQIANVLNEPSVRGKRCTTVLYIIVAFADLECNNTIYRYIESMLTGAL
jgi:hypothetical protein